MKQIVPSLVGILVLVLAIALGIYGCSNSHEERVENDYATIIDCYINDLGNKNFVLSNGEIVEVYVDNESIQIYDGNFEKISRDRDAAIFHLWLNAEIGMPVIKYTICNVDPIFGRDEHHRRYTYRPKILPNTSIKHVVTRITKYDGELNKLEGKIKFHSGLLQGPSGEGRIKGEGKQSTNFFINVYFEDHSPITVNAADNQLWLDVEVGDTVIEQRINGRTTFIPKL